MEVKVGEANRSGSNLYLWRGRAKAEVAQLCFWHQRQELVLVGGGGRQR